MRLTFFCKYIRVHGLDWSTNPILLKKIDIHVRYTYDDACLHIRLFQNYYW